MWSFVSFVGFALVIVGVVLFVLAVVRWDTNSWKYAVLAAGVVIPIAGGVAGWIALFAGGHQAPNST